MLPDGGFINCAKLIHATHGFNGFWIGFKPCGYRAIVVGAVKFIIYEKSNCFY